MVLEKFLYVLFYRTRKFFDCKRGHINRNVRGSHFGLKSSKKVLPLRDESDARTHRTPTPKAFARPDLVRRSWETPIPFRAGSPRDESVRTADFRSAHASSRRFGGIGRRT